MLKFVITAPSRSGTTYVANLLTEAGLQCGHEATINRWKPNYGMQDDWQETPHLGESSFIAAPFLDQMPESVVKIHLVRPPLDVIRSICGIAHLGDREQPYVKFIDHHVGVLTEPPGPRRAARYWLEWNALAEQGCDWTWRLGEIGVDHIEALAAEVGVTLDRRHVQRALRLTSKMANHRDRAEWIEMEHLGPYQDRVAQAAEHYGVPLDTGPRDVAALLDANQDYPSEAPEPRKIEAIHTGAGWYDLRDEQGDTLDRVRGKDAAAARIADLIAGE